MKRKLSEPHPNPPPYSVEAPSSPPGATIDGSPLASLQDVDLFSAAETLTRLNTVGTSTPNLLSRSPSISSPIDTSQQLHPIVSLVNAMSRLPIVTNAVRYYETSKRNYATFNYAAAFVEKAAIPVISKIEVNLNNIHQARQEKAKKKRRLDDRKQNDKTETKKRLKFCLHILKLANDNISAKVSELQLRISENKNEKDGSETPDVGTIKVSELEKAGAEVTLEKLLKTVPEKKEEKFEENELTRVSSSVPEEETNTEIVKTVKKIIHIISNFRPSSLSAAAEESSESVDGTRDEDVKLRSTIRNIILNLPTQIQKSKSSTTPCQDRVMEFARESLDMISLLTTVFNEQLEKAESWVDGPEKASLQQETPDSSVSERPAADLEKNDEIDEKRI